MPFFLHRPLPRTQAPIGFLRPPVARALLEDHHSQLELHGRSSWSFYPKENQAPDSLSDNGNGKMWALSFSPHVWNRSLRTDAIKRVVKGWKRLDMFPDVLEGRSDEECPVYLPSGVDRTADSGESMALTVQRAALPLFSFPNFGTLLVGFCQKGECPSDLQLWIARRSRLKRIFPGFLDVVSGGNIGLGQLPVESVMREASEGASLPESYLAKHVRSSGNIVFSHRSSAGWLLPGLYHTFQLPLPMNSLKTFGHDGEVESFELLDAQECLDKLVAGEFAPSSALAILNFLVRERLYTRDVDVGYDAVLEAMQRDLVVPIF